MLYSYKCEHCSKLQDIDMPMMSDHPKTIKCDCGHKAYRNFGTNKVKIPESFQSQSDIYGGDSYANFDTISSRMKHSRPSGRQKAIY